MTYKLAGKVVNLELSALDRVDNAIKQMKRDGGGLISSLLTAGSSLNLRLSFPGPGGQRPTPSRWNMLMDSQLYMAARPWLTIFPGLAIRLIILAVNFIGEGLHDAVDPTSHFYEGN